MKQASFFVPLRLTHGASGIYLSPLRGLDELLLEDDTTRTALALLDSLQLNFVPAEQACTVADIVTADRDRVFADLYIRNFGEKVESTLRCRHCGEPFDLDFSLHSLLHHYPLLPAVSEAGVFQIGKTTRFRLPTGADELALHDIAETTAEDFLLARCLVQGNLKKAGARVQEKMSEIAPVLNLAMEACCPACSAVQEVHFDIQTFFLTRLRQEAGSLHREVHQLAKCYHWTADTILQLPRQLRKIYAAIIETELDHP